MRNIKFHLIRFILRQIRVGAKAYKGKHIYIVTVTDTYQFLLVPQGLKKNKKKEKNATMPIWLGSPTPF